MNIDPIIINSIMFLGGTGLVCGILLGFAAKKFAVKLDPKEEKIIELLPGVNCGACAFAGCAAYAEALVHGEADVNKCTVVAKEQRKDIAKVLGQEVDESHRKVAVIMCGGGENCKDKMKYEGVKECSIVNNVFRGYKECSYGCLCFGDCVRVCPFGAITQKDDKSVPEINLDKCTGCGICVSSCPRNLIKLVPCKFHYHILCKSEDKGARVRQICKPGCIGCSICVKNCPVNDIELINNVAVMKYKICTNCGKCMEKCPTKTIVKLSLTAPKPEPVEPVAQ